MTLVIEHRRGRVAAIAILSATLLAGMAGCGTTRRGGGVEPRAGLATTRAFGVAERARPSSSRSMKAPSSSSTIAPWWTPSCGSSRGGKEIELSQEDAELLASSFRDALVKELGRDYKIVDQPGPNTLRVRSALTEARKSNVTLDIPTTILPPIRMLSTLVQTISSRPFFTGRAKGELEVVDSITGQRLGAAVDSRFGTKAAFGVFNSWSDVRAACDVWAQRLRKRLEAQREREAEAP